MRTEEVLSPDNAHDDSAHEQAEVDHDGAAMAADDVDAADIHEPDTHQGEEEPSGNQAPSPRTLPTLTEAEAEASHESTD